MTTLPLAFAFSAGVLASVNPCAFAMLPGFVSYYLGGKESEEMSVTRRFGTALVLGTAVTFGFMTLFVGVGVLISAGGSGLFLALAWFGFVVGVAPGALRIWS